MNSLKLDIEQIKNDYLSGLTIRQIAEKHDVSPCPIRSRLISEKVGFRKGKILKGLEDEIKKKYIDCKNSSTLALEYGVSLPTMIAFLREMGLSTARKKFKVNHDFFEEIDTAEKAYWFGWMMSDGNISGRRVKLALIDEEVLAKFKKAINFEGEVLRYQTSHKDIFSVCVNSRKMANDLKKHGCIEKKTFLALYPNIRSNLVRFFIRGYFEGDGCVKIRRHNNQAGVSFVGNVAVLLGIKGEIEDKCGVNFYTYRRPGKKYMEISCDGNKQVKRIRDYLYAQNEIYDMFLPRKLEILKKIQ